MRGWTLLFAALTLSLCVALTFALRDNRRLRDQLVVLAEAKARAGGLEQGRVLAPFTLRDAAGNAVPLSLADEPFGTVLLFHASACGACDNSRPFWRSAIEQAGRPEVRVLCIQTDALEDAPLAMEGLPASLAVPLPPLGWLAALPAVPATLVVDERGVLTRAWYGELGADTARELAATILALGTTGSAPSSR